MWTTTRLLLSWFLFTVGSQLVLSACTSSPTGTTKDTFDMTSSTTGHSWFTEDGVIKDDYRVMAFTTSNLTVVRQNMAQGQGEYLASLGTLLGVRTNQQARFASLVQDQYPALAKSDPRDPAEVVASLTRMMENHPELGSSPGID